MHLPNKPSVPWTISLGNIITIAAGIAAFLYAWGETNGRLSDVEDMARKNEAALSVLSERVRVNETGLARQDERWISVEGRLGRIEDGVDRIADRLDADK